MVVVIRVNIIVIINMLALFLIVTTIKKPPSVLNKEAAYSRGSTLILPIYLGLIQPRLGWFALPYAVGESVLSGRYTLHIILRQII